MGDRIYATARWKRLRLVKLSMNPLCEVCLLRDQVTPAKHVDHIVSIASGGDPFPVLEGLRAMCVSCHSIKTAAKDRQGGTGIAFKGCNANGLPLDPDHPFLDASHTPLQGRQIVEQGTAGGIARAVSCTLAGQRSPRDGSR